MILLKKQTLLLAICLISLFPQTSPQTISMILQAPAHVYRVQSYVGGSINITLSWTSNQTSSSTYLTMCLLKGGQYFDTTSCRGTLTRTGAARIGLNYDVPISDAYFLRIDCSSEIHTQWIKYTLTISTSNPSQRVSYLVGYDVADPSKIVRYFNGQISQNSYQKLTVMNPSTSNQLRSGSFSAYDAINFTSNAVFNVIFDGPSDMVSQFTQLSNEQKCFIDVTYEVGMFMVSLIFVQINPFALLTDVAMLGLQIGTNDNCIWGDIVGGSILAVLLLVGLFVFG